MSAHLIRQFIASSICIYVVVQYLTTQRIKVFLAIMAFFIHFSVSLFFFLIIIMRIAHSERLPSTLTLINSVIILVSGYLIIYFVAINLPSSLLFHAIVTRIINPAGQIDFSPLNLFHYCFTMIILGCSVYNLAANTGYPLPINCKIIHRSIIAFCILILASSFINAFSK